MSATAEQWELIEQARQQRDYLVIACKIATVVYDDRRATPYELIPAQAVGIPKTLSDRKVLLQGFSFATEVRRDKIVGVWLRNDAPPVAAVDELLIEKANEVEEKGDA